jgi:hypothetical protein
VTWWSCDDERLQAQRRLRLEVPVPAAVHWTPGGPWKTKRQGQEAEQRHRDRLEARRTGETCASFAERWLEEW